MKPSPRAAVILTFTCFGCSAYDPIDEYGYDPNDDEATEAEYTERVAFNKNLVLEDLELTDWQSMTTAEVQAFLEVTPYGWRSVLADHVSNGVSAAESFILAAQTHHINPLVLLTRVQLEQSLIGKQTATQTALNWAMGCGCPDNQACNPAYKGFDKQIACSASRFRSYLDDIAATGKTVSGWGPNITKTSLEGSSVTPQNAATAAIYTYTPWVSSAENHVKIWSKYVTYVGYVPGQTPDPDPGEGEEEPPPTQPGPVDIVIDSNDALNESNAKFTASTSWTTTSSTAGYYGSNYLYRSTGATTDAAHFQVYLSEPASVIIEAWWTSGTNRSTTAPFLVFNANGDHLGTYHANQQQGGGAWRSIGTYALTAGWNEIALSRWTTSGYVVIADALRVRTP